MLVLGLIAIGFAVGPTADAAPIVLDLNTFSQKGNPANGDWVVNTAGDSVMQNTEGDPTFFISPDTYRDTRFRGFITTPAADDDFIGVVVEHQNPSADGDLMRTVLVDWKGVTQEANGYTAEEGFTVTRYDGTVSATDVWACFWGKNTTDCPAPLTVLGSNHAAGTGWLPGTTYELSVRIEENLLRVFVSGGQFGGGQVVVDIPTGPFGTYNVGLYTFHQPGVTFHGWNIDDFVAPTVTVDATCATPGDNGWCIGPVDTSATATDLASGVATLTCDLAGTPTDCTPTTRSDEGPNTFTATATDNAGNTGTASAAYMIDSVAPDVSVDDRCATVGAGGFCATSVRVRGLASDATSGLATATCALDGATVPCGFRWIVAEGIYTYTVTATDNAGLTSTVSKTIKIDKSAPIALPEVACTPWFANGWCKLKVDTSEASVDTLSGVAAVDCFLDGVAADCANTVASDGEHNFTVVATDGVGLTSTASSVFRIDSTEPTGEISNLQNGCAYDNGAQTACSPVIGALFGTLVSGTLDVNVTAADSGSGIDHVEFWIDGWKVHTVYAGTGDYRYLWDTTAELDGPHELEVRILDVAGNFIRIDMDLTTLNGNL